MVGAMDDQGVDLEAVKDEAALWVARLRGGDCTLQDERAFRTWLTSSPAHAAAFEAMQATWELTAALPDSARLGYRRPQPARRELIWGLGAAAIAGGAIFGLQGAAAKTYETRVGEQKHVTLPDGSLIFLDTDTRVSFQMRGELRLMKLNGGRANLRVVPDKDSIFRIEAGHQAVVTQQSQIDVFDDSGTTSVTVIDGLASVETGRPGKDQKLALRGGERLRISAARLVRDRPNLSALMAWQRGQIVFDNSTLAQAAADLNRYSDMKLVVEDPVVASWLVSGVFPVGDNRAFVRAAAKFLPLGMIQMPSRILMVQAGPAKLG